MCFYFAGDVAARAALDLSARTAHIDLVEPDPPDLNHKHVQNSHSLILLVRSNI